jgi:hypothetical protein
VAFTAKNDSTNNTNFPSRLILVLNIKNAITAHIKDPILLGSLRVPVNRKVELNSEN